MTSEAQFTYGGYWARHWTAEDREDAARVVQVCQEEYGLEFNPAGDDEDAVEIERFFHSPGKGEFLVIEEAATGDLVGTGGFYERKPLEYECSEVRNAVEIRKIYLLPRCRGKGLGRALLKELERRIKTQGYRRIYLQSASVFKEACGLYHSEGYRPICGVETAHHDPRADQQLYKDI